MITGKTKVLAVIGHPVGHSLSPVFQNAGIRACGLDYVYTAMPVEENRLQEAVQGMKALGIAGMNVTIPHKQAVMEYLDDIDEDARMLGAVNTIVSKDGKLSGCNTDVKGFLGGMQEQGFSPRGKHCVVLGAGGAARAIIWGLIKEQAASIVLGVRNVEKAQQVVEYFAGKIQSSVSLSAFDWSDEGFAEKLEGAQLIVNTTPLGMYPKTDAMPPIAWSRVSPGTFAYDIIYTPAETMFLKTAALHGCQGLNGEAMLVGQGAESFFLWTGVRPDKEIMIQALRDALKE